jgi:glycosyltransferase involved in cell wall biosynthesis
LPSNVRCLGRLPAAELRGLFLECDLFLATSRETSGQAHLEALAAGVPVLSYAWGGLPESVTPACAVLTPPDDLAGYVAGYDQALTHLAALKQAAPAQAAKYTWAQSAPRYVQLYNELMQ